MDTLSTSYQRDYTPPYRKRLGFLRKTVTFCPEGEATKVGINTPRLIPVDTDSFCKYIHDSNEEHYVEIARLQRMVEVEERNALIEFNKHDKIDNSNIKNMAVKVLRRKYPHLLDGLKSIPQADVERIIDKDRCKSVYAIDYDTTSDEFKEKMKNNYAKCLPYLENYPERRKRRKVEKLRNIPNERYVSDEPPPCLEKKIPRISEYWDTINRYGCMIVANDLHNHTNCVRQCLHNLTDKCLHIR